MLVPDFVKNALDEKRRLNEKGLKNKIDAKAAKTKLRLENFVNIIVVVKSDTEDKIKYSLDLNDWKPDGIDFKINFERPELISKGNSPDQILMEVTKPEMFIAKSSGKALEQTNHGSGSPTQAPNEVDVDAISDGNDTYIAGIMEHIEEAGIHSGDSACALPPQTLNKNIIDEIITQTTILAKALNVIGLMNIQFAIQENKIFILEVNPRGSRTIPFVAKATGVPLAKIASQIMIGKKLSDFKIQNQNLNHISVKEAVFPFSRFPGTDVILGPEMKSTGEVMGIGSTFGEAFAKSQLGASIELPIKGQVFISIKNDDKQKIIPIAQRLFNLGFKICATSGTAKILNDNKIQTDYIKKVIEGRPNAVDAMLSGEIQLVINTVEGSTSIKDSFSLRQTALLNKIPYYTTLQGANAATLAIKVIKEEVLTVKSLQSYFE